MVTSLAYSTMLRASAFSRRNSERIQSVVLSNNNGCVVAQSEEAKRLGITMSIPFFQIEDLIERERVAFFRQTTRFRTIYRRG